MKKHSLKGWQTVFTFTFQQTLKNKTFKVTTIILLIIAFLSMPTLTFISKLSNKKAAEKLPIDTIYVVNETGLEGLTFVTSTNPNMAHIKFATSPLDSEALEKEISDQKTSSVILKIQEIEGIYYLTLLKAASGPVKEEHLSQLLPELTGQFRRLLVNLLEISDEQLELIDRTVKTKVSLLDASGEIIIPKENSGITMNEYWFIYGIIFLIFMINMFASSQIATAIVTEKSSKVMENLLISVKPLALMIGKILSVLCAVIAQMLLLFITLMISTLISMLTFSTKGNPIMNYLPADLTSHFNPINILGALILIILGLIFYSTLAGLTGATVSKIEELNEGLMLFGFVSVIGVYISFFASGTLIANSNNPFVTFALIFPLSSPFILPGAFLSGNANWIIMLIAIALEVILVVALFWFVARVYETLILHSGNKVKLRDLLKIARKPKKEGKHE